MDLLIAYGQISDTNTAVIDKLQSALYICMIGGNHIASNLLCADIDPIDYENYDDARNSIATKYDHKSDKWLPLYEDWCCWRTIMDARKIARDALKEYTGEVKECFKDEKSCCGCSVFDKKHENCDCSEE